MLLRVKINPKKTFIAGFDGFETFITNIKKKDQLFRFFNDEELKALIKKLNSYCKCTIFPLTITNKTKEKITKACEQITKEINKRDVKFFIKDCKKTGSPHHTQIHTQVHRISVYRYPIRLVIEINIPTNNQIKNLESNQINNNNIETSLPPQQQEIQSM
ncbi:hypothetical protein DLAC_03037 [Tieghemostelium lacteum]|uniref:Uncharacterized protein n=1 Tax=Tieghemostelium lacteum TaxID=361077 RepID=A0A152A3W6_TIELA|nr:hypothetical protein DLAC_03037 [Tieghemostelium lacteum]|eukprot:KYR00972.1 hypothetical protein DLAC_03037 [Tieghemostelium lacteum]